jgi:hypothetical protein
MLQSKAGYIDARPHIPQLEEVLLQRTAGPYIESFTTEVVGATPRCMKADIRLARRMVVGSRQ